MTAAAVGAGLTQVASAADMSRALEPLLGRWAGVFFATGLLAAGASSAITAPLAAAYATCGVLGWDSDLSGRPARAVWGSVVLVGVLLSAAALRPVPAIVFAQATNGLLLPVIAGFLIYAANDRELLGARVNGAWSNGAALAVLAVTALLGLRSLAAALGLV